jgi:hypothetical protein
MEFTGWLTGYEFSPFASSHLGAFALKTGDLTQKREDAEAQRRPDF